MLTIAEIGDECVGCRSCEQSCPQKCITIQENSEGFLYPSIQEDSCIKCGTCVRKCPAGKAYENRREPIAIYALREKDKKAIIESASGGASDAVVGAVLAQGGIIYGAAYDDDLSVRHIEVADEAGRKLLQSSKYVQSDLGDCYTKAKQRLDRGETVLFTGTPCQIAGLYSFLGEEYANLYTIDLICHGVPSPMFFKKYIEWQGRRMRGNVIYYNFRSKEKRGWGTQYLIKTKTKTKTKTLSLDRYGKHFMAGDCYRECCYLCRYASVHHPGDLTIGDFWGVSQSHPEFFSELGVSLALVNSEKGHRMLGWINEAVELITVTIDEAMFKQGNLKQPTGRTSERDRFYKGLDSKMFIDNLKVGIQPKERFKAMLPANVVRIVKAAFGNAGGVKRKRFTSNVAAAREAVAA